jgi:hypothetical protein
MFDIANKDKTEMVLLWKANLQYPIDVKFADADNNSSTKECYS